MSPGATTIFDAGLGIALYHPPHFMYYVLVLFLRISAHVFSYLLLYSITYGCFFISDSALTQTEEITVSFCQNSLVRVNKGQLVQANIYNHIWQSLLASEVSMCKSKYGSTTIKNDLNWISKCLSSDSPLVHFHQLGFQCLIILFSFLSPSSDVTKVRVFHYFEKAFQV